MRVPVTMQMDVRLQRDAMGDKGRLIIISAPSGAGKTSVIHRFLSTHPDMIHSISWTTRPARPGNIDEGYYHIVDKEAFQKGIEEGMFAEWAEVHKYLYGTPKKPLDQWLSEGKDVLLDLDVVGGLKLKEMYNDQAISIFLLPPSIDELKKRLTGRRTDSAEAQEIRLNNALEELECKDKYDYQVVNDVLEKACREIEEILDYETA